MAYARRDRPEIWLRSPIDTGLPCPGGEDLDLVLWHCWPPHMLFRLQGGGTSHLDWAAVELAPPKGRPDQRERALNGLLSSSLEPIADLAAWSPEADTYEVATAHGHLR